ncbi:MAG TPA: hypothetical protein VGG29_16765 [Caulobacteraceae bacterium]|jgi:hypothetical protein
MPQDAPSQGVTYKPGPAWAGVAAPMTAPRTGLLPPGAACQPCPDCGGLECLCRPRFFAGQLLTEQDLNRLDEYIVAKNRLHNRYLVGTGVVCGLNVTCSPCGDTVSVSSGYAIDTCGNDIIVCSPDTVDVCKLINACTPKSQFNCAPYKVDAACKEANQTWILAVSYQEAPSRGVTPLTGPSQCSCGAGSSCSCGGSSTKGCSCGSGMPASSCCGHTKAARPAGSTLTPRRGAATQCEPTVTCEGYRYEVFLAPDPPAPPSRDPVKGVGGLAGLIKGEMFERMWCCLQGLLAVVPPLPGSSDQTTLSNWCCNLRLGLVQYVMQQGGTDCQAMAKLQSIACPSPTDANFDNDFETAVIDLAIVGLELGLDCVCQNALPPCPIAGDARVPLAAVTVRASDCTVLSVCDWTPLRKHVVTNRTLGYWLGWLPFVPMIRTFMHNLCCEVLSLRRQVPGTATFVNTHGDTTADLAAGKDEAAAPQSPFEQPILVGRQTYRTSNPISEAVVANLAGRQNSITFGDLRDALFTSIDPGTEGEDASAQRLAATPHARVLAELARPLIAGFAPLARAATGKLGDGQTTASRDDIAGMRADIEALRNTVSTQQAALDALRAPPAAAPPPAGQG